jgi:hypothetical protein
VTKTRCAHPMHDSLGRLLRIVRRGLILLVGVADRPSS